MVEERRPRSVEYSAAEVSSHDVSIPRTFKWSLYMKGYT
jgi:hypothetical protein